MQYNFEICRHGVRQLLSAWADGPAYITQCPIQPRQSYVYRFQIVGQRGTLFWHAHYSWLRATVYGAFIILPKNTSTYPFPKPNELPPLLLGMINSLSSFIITITLIACCTYIWFTT